MSSETNKRKVVILGGGPGGMATAFALTRDPEARKRVEVTVYQPGWRLGGKCASGFGDRIEEHGLHVWAGFYDNAFEQLRECYEARGLNWQREFHPVQDLELRERHDDRWKAWPATLPKALGTPGVYKSGPPTIWDIVRWLTGFVGEVALAQEDFRRATIETTAEDLAAAEKLGVGDTFASVADMGNGAFPGGTGNLDPYSSGGDFPFDDPAKRRPGGIVGPVPAPPGGWPPGIAGPRPGSRARYVVTGASLVIGLINGIQGLEAGFGEERAGQLAAVVRLSDRLHSAAESFLSAIAGITDTIRRSWLQLRVATAILRGIFADDLLRKGLSSVDDEELRAWLLRHGCSQAAAESAIVTAGYDWAFAYDGDRPAVAAGVAIQGFFRLLLDYRGAAFWKSEGSLGDLVYAPMYQVLKERGVRFRFFHRAALLEPDASGKRVERIQLVEQARIRDDQPYSPLVPHPTRPGHLVWPPGPDFEQLVDGAELEDGMKRDVDLESGADTDDWSGRRTRSIARREAAAEGEEVFDEVVVALPPAAQKAPCAPLANASPRYRRMLDGIRSAKTVAMQLWFEPSLPTLGYQGKAQMTTACRWPFTTWADMTHLVGVEPATKVRSIVYLCGNAPSGTPDDPVQARRFARDLAVDWLDAFARAVWPAFDYGFLHAPAGTAGKARLDHQYVRANVRPTELYVLSLPGTIALRLPPDDSGFVNLFLAGDWTRTDLCAGCVEAAVSSGETAAQAILKLGPV